MSNNVTDFNKEDIFHSQVEPLLNDLKKICKVHKLPFFCAFATANNKKGTSYQYDGVLTGSCGIELTNNQFENFLMVCRGAKLQPLGAINEFDAETMDYIMDGSNEIMNELAALSGDTFSSDDGCVMIGDI